MQSSRLNKLYAVPKLRSTWIRDTIFAIIFPFIVTTLTVPSIFVQLDAIVIIYMRLYAGQNQEPEFVSVYNFMDIIVYICDGKLEEAHLHIAIYTRKSIIHTKGYPCRRYR